MERDDLELPVGATGFQITGNNFARDSTVELTTDNGATIKVLSADVQSWKIKLVVAPLSSSLAGHTVRAVVKSGDLSSGKPVMVGTVEEDSDSD